MTLPLSSNPLSVAARTLTGSNPSHSLKAAETAARCVHTGQGSKPATEASRCLWRVISGAYGLRKNRSGPNGLHHLARTSEHHLARTSEHHLARTSEHHKPTHTLSIIQGHTLSIIQGGTSEHHLARESEHHKLSGTSKHHKLEGVSLHHLAAARVSITYPPARVSITYPPARVSITYNGAQVSITNPGAQFFILKAANPRMIRGSDRKQFFIPRTISIAYSIRDAYGSALNDKLRL
jgi:hypothetical protein